jgi:hypothetical protein
MENQTDDVNLPEISALEISAVEIEPSPSVHSRKRMRISWSAFISILLAFALGLSSGYFAWGRQTTQVDTQPGQTPLPPLNILTPSARHGGDCATSESAGRYPLPVAGRSGRGWLPPARLIIRSSRKSMRAGQPLADEQIAILTKDSHQPIAIKPITLTSCSTSSGR